MGNKELIITLDLGTTGVKCAVFSKKGTAIYSDTIGYKTYFPQIGRAEQRPQEQLEASIKAIKGALSQIENKNIVGLVFTGTMNGCIPVNAEGEELYNNIIHSDIRSNEEVAYIKKHIPEEEFYYTTGNLIDVHSGLPKYLWLKNHKKEIYSKASAFINIKDYMYGKFTERFCVTDYSDASLCSCMDMYKKDWAWDILAELKIESSKMPKLLKSTNCEGKINAKFSKLTGLKKGLPIIMGGGDGACAAHGARQHEQGDAYMNIGSSAWISSMSKKPIIDPKMRVFNYYDLDDDCYNVCGTLQTGASALDWAIENLVAFGDETLSKYKNMEKLAQEAEVVARGLFFLPTFMGERTPWWTAEISGTLIGMNLEHKKTDVARAVYEGILQGLNMCKEALDENALTVESLIAIGGGAKSRFWMQMASDLMGIPVSVHSTAHHATSLGAMFAAGVGIGLYESFEEAGKYIRTKETFTPDKKQRQIYRKQYAVYEKLYPNMKKAYELIYDFQKENWH